MQKFLNNKVTRQTLPIAKGPSSSERIIPDTRGTLIQILNRQDQSFKRLVYFELHIGLERGHHVHNKEEEHVFIVSGIVQLLVKDMGLEDSKAELIDLRAGDRITIAPGLAHAYRAISTAQALEYSVLFFSDAAANNDRTPCKLDWPD